MTGLRGDGETRVYFLPTLRDASAPTPEELAAATEVGQCVDVGLTADPDAPGITSFDGPVPPFKPALLSREITLVIPVNVTVYRREVRRLIRRFRRLDRALQREDPRRRAMHADYARRRKARHRR